VENEVAGFIWDFGEKGNVQHIDRHDVTVEDVYEVLHNAPTFFADRPDANASHIMLGPNLRGRFLHVAMVQTMDDGIWYVVTANWLARRRGERLYERHKGDDE
jgi:hypothetical protein